MKKKISTMPFSGTPEQEAQLNKDDEEKDPKKKQKDILLDEAIRIACDHANAAE